jgi:hypothetical protein
VHTVAFLKSLKKGGVPTKRATCVLLSQAMDISALY